MRAPRPAVVLAAGTVGGAGTEVALRAALRAVPPAGRAIAMVPGGWADDPGSSGWDLRRVRRPTALLREVLGAPTGEAWVGFCDRLPLLRRGGLVRVLVVQNPHLYRPLPSGLGPAQRLRLAVLARWARRSARSADVVVCSTAASADEVAAATGIERRSVVVLPIPAIDVPDGERSHRSAIERVLVVGDHYDHKRNHEAVEAARRFARQVGRPVTLIHIGVAREATAASAFERSAADAEIDGVVVERRGQVPHVEVFAAMADADVLLLPSALETQGLPLVEAHAAGLPVVCRGIGPFLDLGGDAVVPVPVEGGPDDLARALHGVDERAARVALADAGRRRHPPGTSWDLLGLLGGAVPPGGGQGPSSSR